MIIKLTKRERATVLAALRRWLSYPAAREADSIATSQGKHKPLDNRINRETYFARCWPHSAQIADFNFINLVADRDRVFVTYEGRGADGRVFRNTEIVTVRKNQIVDVEVYFGWSIPHEAKPGGFLENSGS